MTHIRRAQSLAPELSALRRDFHRHPELAFEEHRTGKVLAEKLADLGYDDVVLDRITAPIGIEIHAETPQEIAVSILSQVIAQTSRARD